MKPATKRRMVRPVERWAVNPLVKAVLRTGLPLPMLAVLETTGRRTGKRRRVPLMNGLVGSEFWIVAEHGRRAGYVRNLIANPRVRIKHRGRWMEGVANVLDDDDPFTRARWIAEHLGRSPKAEALVTRLLSAEPVTVRVDMT